MTDIRAVLFINGCPGRELLIVHKRSSKSLFMGDGDEIFLVGHDVMLTLISTIWETIMNG